MPDPDDDSDAGFFPQTPDLFEAALCHQLFQACKEHEADIQTWRRNILIGQHVCFCYPMLANRDVRGAQEIRGTLLGVHSLLESLNPHAPPQWNMVYLDHYNRAMETEKFDWERGWRSTYFMLSNALVCQDAICFWALRIIRSCADSEEFYRSDDRFSRWFRHVFRLFH